jgi:transcriptional regulator with XRE-family HTH domain
LTKQSEYTESHTDLGIADELKNKDFRDQFFRTEREVDIPAQLKSLRKMRGLNQEDLALMIGTKQSGISRLERSSHGHWNLETLVKIAEALDARLAVTIEPYEVVIARFKVEENKDGQSAATAEVGSKQPPKSILAEEGKPEPLEINARSENKKGSAAWS